MLTNGSELTWLTTNLSMCINTKGRNYNLQMPTQSRDCPYDDRSIDVVPSIALPGLHYCMNLSFSTVYEKATNLHVLNSITNKSPPSQFKTVHNHQQIPTFSTLLQLLILANFRTPYHRLSHPSPLLSTIDFMIIVYYEWFRWKIS